jgi:hypothetical protein
MNRRLLRPRTGRAVNNVFSRKFGRASNHISSCEPAGRGLAGRQAAKQPRLALAADAFEAAPECFPAPHAVGIEVDRALSPGALD